MLQSKFTEAIASYNQAVAKEPTDSYYSKLSQVLTKQGNLDQAQQACQKVAKLGESYDTCSITSLALYQQKGFPAVKAFYTQLAADIPPRKIAELYIKLGNEIFYNDGAKQDAMAAFRQALQVDPKNADAQSALKSLLAN
ncbi:hypothetical protein [Tolypothrix sp. VBCCA 56010]|uniref:hypothetical protein n=1 Tax=Tolypothrix sp. VBCCA 56010 TaxID=3137731 RepID=UPI003D7DB1C7